MKISCIKSVDKIASICKLVKNLNNESTLTIEKDKIFIRVVDRPNVMLVNIEINKSLFEEYLVEKDVNFNIDFEILSKILTSMKGGFNVEDNYNELVFDSIKKKLKRSIIKYAGLKDERPNPASGFQNKYKVKLDEIVEASDMILDVADVVKIVGGERFIISAKGNLEKIEMEIESQNNAGQVELYLSSNYLNILSNLHEGFEFLNIEMETGRPFYFNCNDDMIKLEGWIAPRMEE